jgi:hypothetical protein
MSIIYQLISQWYWRPCGGDRQRFTGNSQAVGKRSPEKDLPKAFQIHLGAGSVLWLPMDHPACRLAQVRSGWPFYLQAARNLKR